MTDCIATTQTPAALAKKLKVLSLTSSHRDASELCALTTFGLLVLKTNVVPDGTPAFITRGAGKAPLLAYPSTAKVILRFFGEETSSKQEDYKLQSCGDAPNERLRTPLVLPCPSNASYLAAILPISSHFEVLDQRSKRSVKVPLTHIMIALVSTADPTHGLGAAQPKVDRHELHLLWQRDRTSVAPDATTLCCASGTFITTPLCA